MPDNLKTAPVAGKNNTANTATKDTDNAADGQGGEFSLPELIIWIIVAVITDLLSLVPYVGLVVSWPFAASFGLYKWIKKLNFKKTFWASALDFGAEGLFSTLPANLADVIITYFLSRVTTIMPGMEIPGGLEKAVAVTATKTGGPTGGAAAGKVGAETAGKTPAAGAGEKAAVSGAGGPPEEKPATPAKGAPPGETAAPEEARPAPPTKPEGEGEFREEAREVIERGAGQAGAEQRPTINNQQPTTDNGRPIGPTSVTTPTPTTSTTFPSASQPVTGIKPPLPVKKPEAQDNRDANNANKNEVEAEGNILDLAA